MKLAYVYVYGDPKAPLDDADTSPVIARSVALGERVIIDYDHEGKIYGVEVINAQKVTQSFSDEIAGEIFRNKIRRLRRVVTRKKAAA
jgi:uncharacterized protein YuzE